MSSDLSTAERLARVLEATPGVPAYMVEAARKFAYDDYKSLSATPLNDLVADLRALPAGGSAAVLVLIGRVINGDFDGTREEAEEWARSPEGQETMRAVMSRRSWGES